MGCLGAILQCLAALYCPRYEGFSFSFHSRVFICSRSVFTLALLESSKTFENHVLQHTNADFPISAKNSIPLFPLKISVLGNLVKKS